MNRSRRDFLKTGSVASAGLFMTTNAFAHPFDFTTNKYEGNELLSISDMLLKQWVDRLLTLQVKDPKLPGLHGGILCPACARIHGRVGDAIYPMLFLADKTQDQKYVDGAIMLYDWMERMVSLPEGSWVNDVNVNDWKGTTVFGAIALCEALMSHGHLLNENTRNIWRTRLIKAVNYLPTIITMDFGNINYPITSAYAYSLIGTYLNDEKFIKLGREFAHNSLEYFTEKDTFLFGEGRPKLIKSPKGCYSIDLGYNVEESLPALTQYALHTNDKEVLEVVIKSLKTHMEFVLPDGAWDNSWGTRNFKWTYWGSRTSDGCQTAYALLADKVPEFYRVALQNTKLLANCTNNGYLYGGPHYVSHDILPCVHHAFSHSKAMATVLHNSERIEKMDLNDSISLPREKEYGVKPFSDIQTWLVSKDDWRGTITGYDREYNFKNGHATGGALSMLWHTKVGPIITASMNKYQTPESNNMQVAKGIHNIPLTPRFEFLDEDEHLFMNISDLKATIEYSETDKKIVFKVLSHLVDENQEHPKVGAMKCEMEYTFKNSKLILKAKVTRSGNSHKVKFYLPIISHNKEKTEMLSAKKMAIHKTGGVVIIESDKDINVKNVSKGRIFNFVPGMEAVPIEIQTNEVEVVLSVD